MISTFIFRAFLYAALFLSFAILSGCSDTVTSDSPPSGPSVNPSGSQPAQKRSDYPPIASAVANADIKNIDGTTFKVADKKGKVILLNMWATWCGPCRAEMPTLVRMQDEHREKGLEIIGLNTDDETVEQINEFAGQMKLNYTLAWADTDLQNALVNISKFHGIPQSFIIDRDGSLRGVFRGAGPADVKKMEELVGLIVNE